MSLITRSPTMSKHPNLALLVAGVLASTLVLAPSARSQSRGELLYSTHCIACHTSQMHWRDKKVHDIAAVEPRADEGRKSEETDRSDRSDNPGAMTIAGWRAR